MCLSADDVNPLCDDCFVKDKAGLIESEDDLCDECRAMLKCYCGCCMTVYRTPEEGGLENGICRRCRERDKEPAYPLCEECIGRWRMWDDTDVFEPCAKCQQNLAAQTAPSSSRTRMPEERRAEGDERDESKGSCPRDAD